MRYYFAKMYGNSVQDPLNLKVYGRVFKVRENCKDRIALLEKKVGRSYSYYFDDGWWVGIEFKNLDDEKAFRKIKKAKPWDLGYGWMIDNILDHDSPRDLDSKFMLEVLDGQHIEES